jgi:hypothetical protein
LWHCAVVWHVGTGVSEGSTTSASRVKIYHTKGINTDDRDMNDLAV